MNGGGFTVFFVGASLYFLFIALGAWNIYIGLVNTAIVFIGIGFIILVSSASLAVLLELAGRIKQMRIIFLAVLKAFIAVQVMDSMGVLHENTRNRKHKKPKNKKSPGMG